MGTHMLPTQLKKMKKNTFYATTAIRRKTKMELKIQRVRHEGNLYKIYGSVKEETIYDNPVTIYDPEDGPTLYANIVKDSYNVVFDIDFDDRNFAIINEHTFLLDFTSGMSDENKILNEVKQALPFLVQEKRLELISGIYPSITEKERIRKEIDKLMDAKQREEATWSYEMIKALILGGK
jgi:hypothetical protein